MENRPVKHFTISDVKQMEDNTSSTVKDVSLLARLPKHLRERVGNAFFSDVDGVLLKRAGGPEMKRYYAAKVESASCIQQGGQEYKKIPAIRDEFAHLTALKAEALDKKFLQLNATVLQHVAFGAQDEAEKLFTDNPDMVQALLTTAGTFTDYSGRTFNCTTYEYAYWAKDTHMCRMLEAHMNDYTKAAMLERIDAIERDGLTYEQQGHVVEHSQHFDMTPFKTALQNYVNGFAAWVAVKDFDARKAASMRVGFAQRDLPVHVINEYCRPDRHFSPLPAFKENNLPRVLTYRSKTGKDEALFPLVVSHVSGLGVDFSLFRGSWCQEGARGMPWQTSRIAAIDLAAVSRLDEVRTVELARLRENLLPVASEHGHGMSL